MRVFPRARSDAIESRTIFSPERDHQSPTHVVDGHVVDIPAFAAARAKSQHDIVKLPAEPCRKTTAAFPRERNWTGREAPAGGGPSSAPPTVMADRLLRAPSRRT